MEKRNLLSVGIDIGTTTTQILFTELTMETSGGFGCVPKSEITNKKILYRSPVYFTPIGNDCIDADETAKIISKEYETFGITPSEIDTGAVIITGESARRRNAANVISSVSSLCGDFVATAAGPDLESYLAGKGSGCCRISEKSEYRGKTVCNIDIGGGTANLGVFRQGKEVCAACLNIGGRLIKVSDGRITYISEKIVPLLKRRGIELSVGGSLDSQLCRRICGIFVEILESVCGLSEEANDAELLLCTPPLPLKPDFFTFSGGVADCADGETDFRYGDIGPYLGNALKNSLFFRKNKVITVEETMRATVIGAGSFTLSLSGSTVFLNNIEFPIKSVPVAFVDFNSPNDINSLGEQIKTKLESFAKIYGERAAIGFEGYKAPSFFEIERVADIISKSVCKSQSLIILMQNDWAKALGQALKRRLGRDFPILCADGINVSDGDFADINSPPDGTNSIPVIIKTLAFG